MAESVVVPSASVAPMPEGASFEEAATLPMNGLTVRLALDRLALKPGETLAVTGAAESVRSDRGFVKKKIAACAGVCKAASYAVELGFVCQDMDSPVSRTAMIRLVAPE